MRSGIRTGVAVWSSAMAVWVGLSWLVVRSAAHGDIIGFERPHRLEGFLKGNTHTHTLRSDGDSAPEKVVAWYRDNGYHFLVLTDHNLAMTPGEFSALEIPGRFVTVPGEEISYDSFIAGKKTAVHVNSICSTATAGGAVIEPVSKALQTAIDRVLAQPGAVAQVNHPNFMWALSESDLFGARGAALLEVANQHPHVANEGGNGKPAVEVLWDRLLTRGKLYYGVADDDMHDLVKTHADLGYEPRRPGKGWVQVAADAVEPAAICEALARGDFYSSNGVELAWAEVTQGEYSFEILPAAGESAEDYTVSFIGDGGKILARTKGELSPSYVLKGIERYVRARVEGPGRKRAWLQPAFAR